SGKYNCHWCTASTIWKPMDGELLLLKCPGPNQGPVICEVCHRQEGDTASKSADYSCCHACNVL
ncbi:unnamed protein product, partial [Bubo scandiacus]